MGNFNRDNKRPKSGFNRGFGGGKPFGGGGKSFGGGGKSYDQMGRGDRTLYKATCSGCGSSCELPFKPTGERPVFCNACFGKQQSSGGRMDRFGGERSERPRNDFFEKNRERPRDNFFEKSGNNNNGEIMEQLRTLNVKLDKLVSLLTPQVVVEKVSTPQVKAKPIVKEEVEVKEKPKKKTPAKKK